MEKKKCPFEDLTNEEPFSVGDEACAFHGRPHLRTPVQSVQAPFEKTRVKVVFGVFKTTNQSAHLLRSIGGSDRLHQFCTRYLYIMCTLVRLASSKRSILFC